jgi:hypothetical protein
LLVIELLDRLCGRFAFSNHLPNLMCCSATLTLFGLCRIFVQMLGYCPPHDAISSIKHSPEFQSSVGTRLDGIRLFGLHQLAVNIEQRSYARNLPLFAELW